MHTSWRHLAGLAAGFLLTSAVKPARQEAASRQARSLASLEEKLNQVGCCLQRS